MSKLGKYKKWADEEGSAKGRFVTYTVNERVEGALLYKRIGLLLAYALVDISYLVLFLVVINFPAMVTFVPALTWIMVYEIYALCFMKDRKKYALLLELSEQAQKLLRVA